MFFLIPPGEILTTCHAIIKTLTFSTRHVTLQRQAVSKALWKNTDGFANFYIIIHVTNFFFPSIVLLGRVKFSPTFIRFWKVHFQKVLRCRNLKKKVNFLILKKRSYKSKVGIIRKEILYVLR